VALAWGDLDRAVDGWSMTVAHGLVTGEPMGLGEAQYWAELIGSRCVELTLRMMQEAG
jgi:hypothetical protein